MSHELVISENGVSKVRHIRHFFKAEMSEVLTRKNLAGHSYKYRREYFEKYKGITTRKKQKTREKGIQNLKDPFLHTLNFN